MNNQYIDHYTFSQLLLDVKMFEVSKGIRIQQGIQI